MASDFDVFISYSHHDQPFVRKLVDRLHQSGISLFFDEADIAVGQSLAESLHRAVHDARYVLVVMSPDYFASQWARQELELAMQQEFESDRTKVIPLLLRDCDIPSLLRAKVYADYRNDEAFEQNYPNVLSVLLEVPVSSVRLPQTEEAVPPPLGSIAAAAAESAELRAMVLDLRTKVEAFMEGS